MAIQITMPALSPTMEEGNLAKWLVKEGDEVSAGDVIAEIETDKATMEVEAVDEGTLAKIMVDEGTEGVKVNAVIALLAEEGEDPGSVESKEAKRDKDEVSGKEALEAEEKSSDSAKSNVDDKASETDMPETQARKRKQPTPQAQSRETQSKNGVNADRIFASPLAKRLAEQNNIDLTALEGSGPHGRIIKADVDNAKPGQEKSASAASPAESSSAQAMAIGMDENEVLSFFEEGSYERVEHNSMRRTIAQRLTQSTQTIPSYNLAVEVELDALLALRKQINEAAPMQDDKPAYKVSVNDLIIKALALALRDVPMANASWTPKARLMHKHADVGVAVAIEDGLITPIVRRAEEKSLSTISIEMKDLAARAREKRLKPEEYQGGSTAVSNLGMFGVADFTSIINPPQASIVSIGAGGKRAVVRDGELSVANMMTATFAFDHRVIDGALGAELSAAFKRYLEKPMGMLV